MIARNPRLLAAAAIALGLALAPVVSFAAAPRAAGQVAHSDPIQPVQGTKKPVKKTPKKANYKKPVTKKS